MIVWLNQTNISKTTNSPLLMFQQLFMHFKNVFILFYQYLVFLHQVLNLFNSQSAWCQCTSESQFNINNTSMWLWFKKVQFNMICIRIV